MKSLLAVSLVAVSGVTHATAVPSWQSFGLDGQAATDLVSVRNLLYATVIHVDGSGNETGLGVWRRPSHPDSSWSSIGLLGIKLESIWVDPLRPDTILVSARAPVDEAVVYRTVDGGHAWEPAEGGLEEGGARITGSAAVPGLLLLAHESHLYRSSNLGTTWSRPFQRTCPQRTYRDVLFDEQKPNVAWAVRDVAGVSCMVLMSPDFGMLGSWDVVIGETFVDCAVWRLASDRFHGRTYLAVDEQFDEDQVVWFTDDGGTSWNQRLVSPTGYTTTIEVAQWNPDYVIAGNGFPQTPPIWLSTDRAVTWQNFSAGLPALPMEQLAVESDDQSLGVFYASVKGRGVWRLGLEGVVGVGSAPHVTGSPLLVVTPNPAAGRVSFEVVRGSSDATALLILDAAGRRVRGIDRTGIDSSRSTTWDGRNASGEPVPPGVYYAKLEGAAPSSVVRFVWLGPR